MDAQHTTTETLAVPAEGHAAAAHEPSILDISGSLALWTWVTFAVVSVVLYKKAWKPILTALDQRETDLRNAVEDAEKVRSELAQLDETRQQTIAEAENKAKGLISEGRKAATEAARAIERKAKEESQITFENATRDIAAAQDKALASLRRESAELAVGLATRILSERLDPEKQQEITDRLINEI